MIPKEVFLSHSVKNKAVASALADTLRRHGVPVWYSSTNIRSAQDWIEEIGKGLSRCDWFLLLLSKASVASKWVKMELNYALNHSQYDDHILSIKIEDCNHEDLSWTLGIFQMVHFNGKSNAGYEEILKTWGLGFDPASNAKPRKTPAPVKPKRRAQSARRSAQSGRRTGQRA
jgi:TIR domain